MSTTPRPPKVQKSGRTVGPCVPDTVLWIACSIGEATDSLIPSTHGSPTPARIAAYSVAGISMIAIPF